MNFTHSIAGVGSAPDFQHQADYEFIQKGPETDVCIRAPRIKNGKFVARNRGSLRFYAGELEAASWIRATMRASRFVQDPCSGVSVKEFQFRIPSGGCSKVSCRSHASAKRSAHVAGVHRRRAVRNARPISSADRSERIEGTIIRQLSANKVYHQDFAANKPVPGR